tara:strand:- start:221 stop:385 length:165 start_codon:yes stop_codon:yes gene_type:complete
MDINKNIEILNTFLLKMRIKFADKLYILNLAKVSKNIEELKENIIWEENRQNIK